MNWLLTFRKGYYGYKILFVFKYSAAWSVCELSKCKDIYGKKKKKHQKRQWYYHKSTSTAILRRVCRSKSSKQMKKGCQITCHDGGEDMGEAGTTS